MLRTPELEENQRLSHTVVLQTASKPSCMSCPASPSLPMFPVTLYCQNYPIKAKCHKSSQNKASVFSS